MTKGKQKRGVELPKGCKDLSDAIERSQRAEEISAKLRGPYPPTIRDVHLPSKMTVCELVELAEVPSHTVLAGLMELGMFANMNTEIDFDHAAEVLRRNGITARKVI